MKTLLFFLLLAGLAITAATTDISGRWSGSFTATMPDGETRNHAALLVLKQSGADITGTAGPNEDEQYPITKGSIQGDKITLELVDNNNHTLKFALVLADDRIKGDVTMTDEGDSRTAKLDVGRVK